MRRTLWLCACLFFAFGLLGCQAEKLPIGGKPRSKVFLTCVSLSPGPTEIVAQKVTRLQILGRTEQCNFPIPNMTQPVVLIGEKPNYELIAKLHPDLIVYDKDLFGETELAKLKELGAELYGFGGTTIEEYADCLYRFGALAGGESDISEYVQTMVSAKDAGLASPMDPKPKVAVMMPGSASEHMIAGVGSFQADVIRGAGAEPIGPDAKIFVPANVEWLVSANPDVLLIAGDSETVEKDPRLASINAIKNKRFAHLNQDIALRRGARVDLFIKDVRAYLQKSQPGGATTGAGN